MKARCKITAPLKQRARKLNAQSLGHLARAFLRSLWASLLRGLRFSRAQVLGGRKLVKREGVWYAPLWLFVAAAVILTSSAWWGDAARLAGRLSSSLVNLTRSQRHVDLAEFLAPAVRHWSDEINHWSAQYEVDAHLLATVMQIESCGHPRVVSNAGAQGLFQVMPFHFAADEDMLDPDTNAKRGAAFLKTCAARADGVIGLTLACYNGGPSVLSRQRENWSYETQRYYRWGVGIYSDAIAGAAQSETMDQWLAAGGERLCARALVESGR